MPELEITEGLVQRALFLQGDEADRMWSHLLSPEYCEETVATLTAMAVQVNNDLAVRKAHADEGYEEWKRRALGFKRAVDRRLPMAKARLKNINRQRSNSQAANARVVLRELALAVLQHQRASAEADINPESHDVELWRALDLLCLPVNDDLYTLRQMVTEGVWV